MEGYASYLRLPLWRRVVFGDGVVPQLYLRPVLLHLVCMRFVEMDAKAEERDLVGCPCGEDSCINRNPPPRTELAKLRSRPDVLVKTFIPTPAHVQLPLVARNPANILDLEAQDVTAQ